MHVWAALIRFEGLFQKEEKEEKEEETGKELWREGGIEQVLK